MSIKVCQFLYIVITFIKKKIFLKSNLVKVRRYCRKRNEGYLSRFVRNCETCYFKDVAKTSQRYVLVSVEKRRELCDRFGYPCYWEEKSKSHQALGSGTLDSPVKKQAVGRLAEVGGECWFSSIYYLLVGRKSGA